MKKYTRTYRDYFGYDETDFIPGEVCNKQAVDIHHIFAKGMGGSNTKDNIENIMALCRECHIKYGDKKQYKDFLTDIHEKKCSR